MSHRIVSDGDSAIVVEFEERLDPAVTAHAIALAEAVQAAGVAGVRDVVPTYRSVAIHFDPLRTDIHALTGQVDRALASAAASPTTARAPIRIPVWYCGEFGPDLPAVAGYADCSEHTVVLAHT